MQIRKWTELMEHLVSKGSGRGVSDDWEVPVGETWSYKREQRDLTARRIYNLGSHEIIPKLEGDPGRRNFQLRRYFLKEAWDSSPVSQCMENLKNQDLFLLASMDVCLEQWFRSLTHQWIAHHLVRSEDKFFKGIHVESCLRDQMMNLILSELWHHNLTKWFSDTKHDKADFT